MRCMQASRRYKKRKGESRCWGVCMHADKHAKDVGTTVSIHLLCDILGAVVRRVHVHKHAMGAWCPANVCCCS